MSPERDAMARQVSGSILTLLEAIRAGEVPEPPLVGWNAWLVWRRDFGKRPRQVVDGYSTTSTQEAAYWKSAMFEYHGEDWAVQVVSLEIERTEVPSLVRATSLEPSATAGQDGESPETQPQPAPPEQLQQEKLPRQRELSELRLSEAQAAASRVQTEQASAALAPEFSLPGLGAASAPVRLTGLPKQF